MLLRPRAASDRDGFGEFQVHSVDGVDFGSDEFLGGSEPYTEMFLRIECPDMKAALWPLAID